MNLVLKFFLIAQVSFWVSDYTAAAKADATLSASISSSVSPGPSHDAVAAMAMPFKLGFEFQEANGLCHWALNDLTIQKKALFEVVDAENSRTLWHVEIDCDDIEFVTEPFSYEEPELLKKCLDSIMISLEHLQTLLRGNIARTNFNSWAQEIENAYKEQGNHFSIDYYANYFEVDDKPIMLKEPDVKWTPRFSPQATIQHPLEYSIFLYFGLFGFDSVSMRTFTASLPYVDALNQKFKEAFESKEKKQVEEFRYDVIKIYGNKINGLVFLHALTMVYMTPLEDDEDSDLLQGTLNCLEQSRQVDAKLKLNLMSRRPFSSMLIDIREVGSLVEGDYSSYYKEGLERCNCKFTDNFNTPQLFNRVNYGEEFSTPLDIPRMLSYFKDDFLAQTPDIREIITRLLTRGVITTTMLRNFSHPPYKTLLAKYYNMAVDIQTIPNKRYTLNLDGRGVICGVTLSETPDVLSPPWFLGNDNSMGKMKAGIDKDYGEAIIEVRGIKTVGEWFLKKVNLNPDEDAGCFLTKMHNLKRDTHRLFDGLKNFHNYTSEIICGIFYAHNKYKH